MRAKETEYIKVCLTAIYVCVLIGISQMILIESGMKVSFSENNFHNQIITHFNNCISFLNKVKIYTENILTESFGCFMGRYLVLCLNSWVLGAIIGATFIKKLHSLQIMKMGIY